MRKPQLHHYKKRFTFRWEDKLTGTNRSRVLPKGIDREEAERRRNDFCIDLDNVTWDRWCEIDIQTHSSKVRESSIDSIDRTYRHISRLLGPDYLRDIDSNMVLEYRRIRYEEGCKPGTINTELAVIQAAFNRAIKRDVVNYNPVDSSMRCNVDEKPISIVSDYYYQILLEAAPTFDWELIIAIGYHVGLRIGEILALNTWDINIDHYELYITNTKVHKLKSGRNRVVPIPLPLYGYLVKRLKEGPRGRVIGSVSMKPNKHCSYNVNNASRNFARICEKAGLVNELDKNVYTTHSLRRTCITDWIRKGCSVEEVKEMAGHKSIVTTLKYYCQTAEIESAKKKLVR